MDYFQLDVYCCGVGDDVENRGVFLGKLTKFGYFFVAGVGHECSIEARGQCVSMNYSAPKLAYGKLRLYNSSGWDIMQAHFSSPFSFWKGLAWLREKGVFFALLNTLCKQDAAPHSI